MKKLFAVLVLICVIPASSVFSQEPTTISYDAVVTQAWNPNASYFAPGTRVVVSYTLDPSVPDSNGDGKLGYFPNGVVALSVSFPDLGIFAIAGSAGALQTFDNTLDTTSGKTSDQVFFWGGPLSSADWPDDGPVINSIEVDFLSNFVISPPDPTMLLNDDMPLFRLPTTDAFILLTTSDGVTKVSFQEIIPPPPSDYIETILDEIDLAVSDGILSPGQANGLSTKLREAIASLDLGETRDACNQLQAFINQVNAFIRARKLTRDEGQRLIDAAEEVRIQIGC
jgi:hypothetical protein